MTAPEPDPLASLRTLITAAETVVSTRQDDLAQSAAALAATVGPLAAAHRLAELAIEMHQMAKDKGLV